MSMIVLPKTETYASMLEKLRVRCKLHPTLGDSPVLKSILTEANEYVFRQLDNDTPTLSTLTVSANMSQYEFTSDEGMPIARGSVLSVWIEQGSSERYPLPQGITHLHRANTTQRGQPERYDTLYVDDDFTLEVWPIPDKRYVLRVDHNKVLTRFSEPTDKPSCSAALVLAYAIGIGQAHYGIPAAQTSGQTFQAMLSDEKYKQHENRRYMPPSSDTLKPYAVQTANGFTQVWR